MLLYVMHLLKCNIKALRGTASTLIKKIKGAMMSSFKTKIGALLIKKSARELKTLDATEYSGSTTG